MEDGEKETKGREARKWVMAQRERGYTRDMPLGHWTGVYVHMFLARLTQGKRRPMGQGQDEWWGSLPSMPIPAARPQCQTENPGLGRIGLQDWQRSPATLSPNRAPEWPSGMVGKLGH